MELPVDRFNSAITKRPFRQELACPSKAQHAAVWLRRFPAISRPLLLPHSTNNASGGCQGSSSSCCPRKPHSLCLDRCTQPEWGGRAASQPLMSPGSSWGGARAIRAVPKSPPAQGTSLRPCQHLGCHPMSSTGDREQLSGLRGDTRAQGQSPNRARCPSPAHGAGLGSHSSCHLWVLLPSKGPKITKRWNCYPSGWAGV